MKFTVVAALMGTASAVQINESLRHKQQLTAEYKKLCGSVDDIKMDQTFVQIRDVDDLGDEADETLPPVVSKPALEGAASTVGSAGPAGKPALEGPVATVTSADGYKKNIAETHTAHYSKSKAEIDAENKHILDTKKKCLDFVKSHPGHTAVCDQCKKQGEPKEIWKWNDAEKVWYKWYDDEWHYWGPSKDGFTHEGWTFHNGYWHHDGYAYKYEDGKWYRFEGHEWEEYGETVPVKPEKPQGKKICRPFYKEVDKSIPAVLTAKQLPRCKVGDETYMWTDEAACNFLGGEKVMEKAEKCSSGESNTWMAVSKCVKGYDLTGAGLDYKTGNLKASLYNFKQCQLVKASGPAFLYLSGMCHKIPTQHTFDNLFVPNAKVSTITPMQLNSCTKATEGLKYNATLVQSDTKVDEGETNPVFLYSRTAQMIETDAFDACQFNKAKITTASTEQIMAMPHGDVINI